MRRADTSGVLTIAVTASRSFSMMGSGVPFGTRKPFHDANTKPGSVSDAVGRSGALGTRSAVPTASSLIAGCSRCASRTDVLPK